MHALRGSHGSVLIPTVAAACLLAVGLSFVGGVIPLIGVYLAVALFIAFVGAALHRNKVGLWAAIVVAVMLLPYAAVMAPAVEISIPAFGVALWLLVSALCPQARP